MASTQANGPSAEAVDFEREILPILQQHCLDCHEGSDAESALSLATPAEVLRGGDSGEPSIVPGSPEMSYLLQRIVAESESERMPPDSEPLSKQEIKKLEAWIEDTASWEAVFDAQEKRKSDHWSFQPLVKPSIPKNGYKHPIDAFLAQQLREHELTFAPPAQRNRLVRRAYLVMHGLPPDSDAVRKFENDRRPTAWSNLVDQLLESSRYGERWATYWLDLARFGETHGYETNRERPNAWPYRDWVIEAFNTDKPFDDFVREQIAGDALGEPIGTGFLVAGSYDIVKGQDQQLQLMQRQDELADMINTTSTAFLGMTLGCARCHNHKFDPISQTDYYAMQAVFAGVNHADRTLELTKDARRKLEAAEAEAAAIEKRLEPYRVASRLATVPMDDKPMDRVRPSVTASANVEHIQSTPARFIRFTIHKTTGGEACIDELEVWSDGANVALASNGGIASSNGDFVHPKHRLSQINDGEYGNEKSWITAHSNDGFVQIQWPEVRNVSSITWARDRSAVYADRLAVDYTIELSRDGEDWIRVATGLDRVATGEQAPVRSEFQFNNDSELDLQDFRVDVEALQRLRRRIKELRRPRQAYVGTFSQPGPTHRLYRGEPMAPREAVTPAAIKVLSDVMLAADSPEQERRVAIANWIASPDNPLTPRVIVNRIWQHHFGTGIVPTPNDFGANGVAPTNQELLDWLAVEFIESGWSIKKLHRLIMTSQAWQQDSRPRPQAMRVDAQTKLLWRFPPRRLNAESIRDSILATTGKLQHEGGGPGFSAFKVEAENVRHYFPRTEFGPEAWRRMVYMTRVRQERDATFGAFDCPDFSQSVARRSRSTTPLQALNLFNSPFVFEQAEYLAERLVGLANTLDAQVNHAFQICYARDASAREVANASQFIESNGMPAFCRAMLNSNEFLFIP